MKVTIFGAGAIGGHLGGLLSRTDAEVTLIARGAHAAAMRERGLRVIMAGGEEFIARPRIAEDAGEVGPQDFVIVSLKSHQAPGAVPQIRPLLGPETAVVTAMNGVPWWYFHKLPGPFENRTLESVDPGRAQWDGIGPERALGGLTFVTVEVPKPGVVKHNGGLTIQIGEPGGGITPRLERIVRLCCDAGFDASARPAIRDDIWAKLLGNTVINPAAALTCARIGEMVSDELMRPVLRQGMEEAKAVAEALGARPSIAIDDRLEKSRSFTTHKSSMLQDLERGRSLEIDPLTTAVAELGDMVGVDTPVIDTILALIRLRGRVAGLY